MTILVYEPQIEILLIKTTGQANGLPTRGAGAGLNGIVITQYLGDAGAVRTMKSLDDPCGAFTITFADREQAESLDTVYALIEPMDMVEIRMSRKPIGPVGLLPLVMRGFVSIIRRSETIAPDGTPQRVVIVSGQDETKLWYIHQLLPETIYASDSPYMNIYDLLAAVGIAVKWWPVSDFITTLTEDVINVAIDAMNYFTGAAVPKFIVDATVPEGILSASLVAPFRGPFWNLAELAADRPWNELWVESTDDGPILHFRPVPYVGIGGAFIMPGAVDPGLVVRDIVDVISWDVSRTDGRTANFYWVPPAGGMLDSTGGVNVASLKDPGLQIYDYPNSARALYGLRKMEYPTRLLPDGIPDTPIRVDPGIRFPTINDQIAWNIHRGYQLRDLNRDNVVFEEIQAVMKGSEDLVVGKNLQMTRGLLTTTAYMTSIAHTFLPLRTWTTTVGMSRGDGYLVRDAYGGDPYWSEQRKGPYD